MEWQGKEDFLLQLEEEGKPVPALDRKPDITGLEWIYNAFWELCSCRPASDMGITAIPWVAINDFAGRDKLNDQEFNFFLHCIRGMDNIYLKVMRQRADTKKKQQEAKSRNRKRR